VLALSSVASVSSVSSHEQQIPQQRPGRASIQGMVTGDGGRGVAGAEVVLKSGTREVGRALTSGDGVFRFIDVAPGDYGLSITREGYAPLTQGGLRVGASELVSVELKLVPTGVRAPEKTIEPGPPTPYGRVVRPKDDPNAVATALPPGEKVYLPVPERWNLPLPEWDRYGVHGDYPYVGSHWWDPFNQNTLKGDYPILGKRTFFNFTGVSDSLLEGRNLPTPSGVSTQRPGGERFFGRGGAYAPVTSVRTSFDLFRGDTVFRPIDWRMALSVAGHASCCATMVVTASGGGWNAAPCAIAT